MPNDYLDKNILEEKIKDAYGEEQFEDLMLFDALILNIDRHLGNFGLLVSSNTQEKIKNAPIFDNGKSLIFDFKTYQGKVGKMHLNNYSSRPSKMCQSLDYQLEKFLFKRHISWIQKLVVCKIGGLIEFSTKASQKRACFLFLALRDIWCFGNTIFSKNNKFKIFYILFSQSENFKSSLNEMIKIWKKSP